MCIKGEFHCFITINICSPIFVVTWSLLVVITCILYQHCITSHVPLPHFQYHHFHCLFCCSTSDSEPRIWQILPTADCLLFKLLDWLCWLGLVFISCRRLSWLLVSYRALVTCLYQCIILIEHIESVSLVMLVPISVLEQKIEQEEETNKSSADLRIRKTQVCSSGS